MLAESFRIIMQQQILTNKKMKNLLTILLFSIISLRIYSQDLIVKNDKTEIKAKIEELTETTIKYKKTEMLDGPSYNINKREVFMIIYKNGTKEYITIPNSAEVNKKEELRPVTTAIKSQSLEDSKKVENVSKQEVDDQDIKTAKQIRNFRENANNLIGINLYTLSKLKALNGELGTYTPLTIGNSSNFYLSNFISMYFSNTESFGYKSSTFGFSTDLLLNYKITIPDNDKIKLFAGAGLSYSSAFVSVDDVSDSFSDLGFIIRANAIYYPSKNIGIYGGLITGKGGNVAITAGVAFRRKK
jgi:hypothetical protein